MEKLMNRTFYKGGRVRLDADLANNSEVIVVEQTPKRLYTIIKSIDGKYKWSVMTYRLTSLKQ